MNFKSHQMGSETDISQAPSASMQMTTPDIPIPDIVISVHTCNLLSSTASVVLLAPGLAAFQNCFCAEYRFIGHSLKRQSRKKNKRQKLLLGMHIYSAYERRPLSFTKVL